MIIMDPEIANIFNNSLSKSGKCNYFSNKFLADCDILSINDGVFKKVFIFLECAELSTGSQLSSIEPWQRDL